MIKHGNTRRMIGNQLAAKPQDQKRKQINIRLPADLIAKLNQLDNKTAFIEQAIRTAFNC